MDRVHTKPRRLGLYGGSFDPIHSGHILLARDALEQLGLDEVRFLPARISPHKLDHPPSPALARLQLLASAIENEPGFTVDSREIDRPGPSYAIDTVREFRTEFPNDRLFFFVGTDNLPQLATWREFDSLSRAVQFVVLSRGGMDLPVDYPVIPRRIEISSSEIRNRVARGLPIRYMVPEPVLQLIESLHLYRDARS